MQQKQNTAFRTHKDILCKTLEFPGFTGFPSKYTCSSLSLHQSFSRLTILVLFVLSAMTRGSYVICIHVIFRFSHLQKQPKSIIFLIIVASAEDFGTVFLRPMLYRPISGTTGFVYATQVTKTTS